MYSPHCAVCVPFSVSACLVASATATATVAAPNDDLFCTHTATASSKRCNWRVSFSLWSFTIIIIVRVASTHSYSFPINRTIQYAFFVFSAHESNMKINVPRFYCVAHAMPRIVARQNRNVIASSAHWLRPIRNIMRCHDFWQCTVKHTQNHYDVLRKSIAWCQLLISKRE